MILIAESGSTKTCWAGVSAGKQHLSFQTPGFNPYIQSREEISLQIKDSLYPYVKDYVIDEIHFYGAGCSSEENKKLMFSCFKSFFNRAEVIIDHDLLGAARALWGSGTGLVAILGTGSNSCFFSNGQITEGMPSLGYILGDEGSGAHMGKLLIKDYLYQKLPDNLMEHLRSEYGLDKEKVLNRIYKMPNPNRWLASFSFFIRDHIDETYCQELVRYSFGRFFSHHLSHFSMYKDVPLGAIGSIAYHYQDFLREKAEEFGFSLQRILKSPVDELVRYHTEVLKPA